jgi:hypothetical protein
VNKERAYLLLNVNSDDELEDAIDEVLFKYKNLLMNTVPFRSVYEKRNQKLNGFQEALDSLNQGGYKEISINKGVDLNNESLLQLVHDFHNRKYELFQKTQCVNSFKELLELGVVYFDLYREYAEHWRFKVDTSSVIASKEVDSQDFIEELSLLERKGVKDIESVIELNEDNIVLLEMKRLNLWLEMNDDGRNFS